MNLRTTDSSAQGELVPTVDSVDDHPDALFAGDTGRLKLDTRRVLVQLLLGPSVDARRQSKLWPVLLRDEDVVRSRLHELFLDLVIDRDQEVAFTRQVLSNELDIPVLLRRMPLTFLDSVLLLHLRQRLTESEAQLERSVVSLAELSEHLMLFKHEVTTDHSRFDKQVQAAVDKAVKHSLLRKIRNSEDRYEVAPTLKLLFSADDVQALAAVYTAKAARLDAPGNGQASDEGDEEAAGADLEDDA